MADGSACGSRRNGCAAGICKEVENTDFFSLCFCRLYFFDHHIPVNGLFRKKSGMFKAGGADFESKVFIIYLPEFRKFPAIFPMSAALGGTDISCIRVFPHWVLLRGVPDYLWVGSYKNNFSPALKSFAFGTIQKFIVFPVFCISHFPPQLIRFLSVSAHSRTSASIFALSFPSIMIRISGSVPEGRTRILPSPSRRALSISR